MEKSKQSTKKQWTGNTPSYRVIKNLTRAKTCEAPSLYAKPPKCKGSRAKGYSYERLVGRRLKGKIERGEITAELISGQWFNFEDANGPGYCQVDHYLLCPGYIILIECKLTQSDYAPDQMTKLYEPILRKVYGVPVICVQVCKNIRKHPVNAIMDIEDLIKWPRGGVFTWHYLG